METNNEAIQGIEGNTITRMTCVYCSKRRFFFFFLFSCFRVCSARETGFDEQAIAIYSYASVACFKRHDETTL